jgi:hypothetical protein
VLGIISNVKSALGIVFKAVFLQGGKQLWSQSIGVDQGKVMVVLLLRQYVKCLDSQLAAFSVASVRC